MAGDKRISELPRKGADSAKGSLAIYDPFLDETVQIKVQEALGATQADMDWQADTTYAAGDFVLYLGQTAWKSLVSSNTGNVPAENAFWTAQTISSADGITDTQWAAGLFTFDDSKVVFNDTQYYLQVAAPFESTDFATELAGGDWATTSIGTVAASAVNIDVLGTPTYTTLEHLINVTGSNGLITGGTITDGGSGTIDIAAGSVMIRSTDSAIGELFSADFSAVVAQALTDGVNNYIYVEYNAGTPQVAVDTIPRSSLGTNTLIGIVVRDGTAVHISNTSTPLAQFNQLAAKKAALLEGVRRQSGSILSETGTRNIAVTAGLWWLAFDEYTIAAMDSSVADTFSYFYSDGASGFTEVASSTQIDNTQYDDGSGTLATLSNNRYGVHWVYRGIDNNTYVVYGTGDYTAQQAADATPPTSVPVMINGFHVGIVAKIIILKSASTFAAVENPFDVAFPSSLTQSHLDLTNIGLTTHDVIDTHIVKTQATKTISAGVVATGADRNLIIAAEAGTADDLIEITGLTIGNKVLLRADTGDTITVKHNDAGATIKIMLDTDADKTLDEDNPLVLYLVDTNILANAI